MHRNTAIIVLAAGLGTRMKSDRAKVLHEVMGRPMVTFVLETANEIVGERVVVVVGHQAEMVKRVISERFHATFALQDRQLGTGHAVACALPYLPRDTDEVLILYGDVPLLRTVTLKRFLREHLSAERTLSILGVEMENPTGYGRLILDASGIVCGIVEEGDADSCQRKIRWVNSGIYCVQAEFLSRALSHLGTDNAQGELYLTDIVGIGYRQGKAVGLMRHHDPDEVLGINTAADLAAAEMIMKQRLRFKS